MFIGAESENQGVHINETFDFLLNIYLYVCMSLFRCVRLVEGGVAFFIQAYFRETSNRFVKELLSLVIWSTDLS